jgi:hypothetical protein
MLADSVLDGFGVVTRPFVKESTLLGRDKEALESWRQEGAARNRHGVGGPSGGVEPRLTEEPMMEQPWRLLMAARMTKASLKSRKKNVDHHLAAAVVSEDVAQVE